MAGPIDLYALRADPLSAGAFRSIQIGGRTMLAVADGFLRIQPDFVGSHSHPTAAYDSLAALHGDVRMPIGCFFLPGEKNVLIDSGFGPSDYDNRGLMVGGLLLEHLATAGVRPEDIDVLVISHLHLDHIGWIGDQHGVPTFKNALTIVARDDWEYFIESTEGFAPPPHIVSALYELDRRGQLVLVEGETQVAPGLTRLSAPGHTPGHSVFAVQDQGERVLLLGDAMYCAQQLTNTDWDAITDVNPVLARQTRETLARDLEAHGGSALGCHFPGLFESRILKQRDR